MKSGGKLRRLVVIASLALIATAASGAQEKAPFPTIAQVVLEDGRSLVAEVLQERQDVLEVLDIKTGVQVTVKRETVKKVVRDLSQEDAIKWAGLAPYLAWRVKQAEQVKPAGQVVTVTPTAVYTNLGEADGIEVKDRVKVYHEGEALTDPKTGEKLGSIRSFIAELEVTEVQAKLSKAVRTTEVESDIQRGDTVELVRARKAVAVMPLSIAKREYAHIAQAVVEDWTTALVKRGVPVVERAQLDRVLLELGLQQTGLMDSDTTNKIGKLVGAYAVLTGTLVEGVQGRGTVHARLLKTGTGEVLVAASESIALSATEKRALPAAAQPIQGTVVPSVATTSTVFRQPAFKEDFSKDPKWQMSDRSRFFWRSQDGVLAVNRVNINGGGNYAYHDVGIDMSGRSFRLEWDVLPQSIDYACDVRFGLYDTGLNTEVKGASYAQVYFTREDRGLLVLLDYGDAQGHAGTPDSSPIQFSCNTWYHVVMQHDASTRTLGAQVTVRDTGQPLTSIAVSGVGPFASDMDRVGASDVRKAKYQAPGAQASGWFDNVQLWLGPAG
jgi:hypothetical protein